MFTKISLIKFFLGNIERRRKFKLIILISLITLVSILEFISLGSVVPLLGALLDSKNQNFISEIPQFLGHQYASGSSKPFFL